MDNKTILKIILSLSIAGVLFAGFLTVSKLLLGVCPLTESCPFLLGYPVCVYGLLFFTIILISTIFVMIGKYSKTSYKTLFFTSIIGAVFSSYYSYQELFVLCPQGCNYSLGVPSCIYGLVMYLGIVALSLIYGKSIYASKKLKSKKSRKK